MHVRDVMRPVAGSVSPDDSIRDAVAVLKSLAMDPFPVTVDGHVVGTLSEVTVLKHANEDGLGVGMVPVRDCMSTDVICVAAGDEVHDALQKLEQEGNLSDDQRVPVTDSGRLTGVVTLHDLRTGAGEGSRIGEAAVPAPTTVDSLIDYETDRVEYASDASFPASDPPAPPSTFTESESDSSA